MYLTFLHAEPWLTQFQETSDVGKWLLVGTAKTTNHIHVIIGVPGKQHSDSYACLRFFVALT